MKPRSQYYLIVMLAILIMAACQSGQKESLPQTTPQPEPTIPAATATIPPTATATATPSPSPSPEPSLTPTMIPTETALPTETPVALEFMDLKLALDYDEKTLAALSPRDYFPLGVSYLAAVFDYNVPGFTKLDWTILDENGESKAAGLVALNSGAENKAIIMRPEFGLDEGFYEFQLQLDDEVVLSQEFEVFWYPTLWPISIGERAYENGEVDGIGDTFPYGTEHLFASYPTINFSVGDAIFAEWFVDGEKIGEHAYIWPNPDWSTGVHANKIYDQLEEGAILPIGHYEIIVYVNNRPQQCKYFEIFDPNTAADTVSTETKTHCELIETTTRPSQDNPWKRYQVRTFADLEVLVKEDLGTIDEDVAVYLEMSPDYQYPSRVAVTYTGQFRSIADDKLEWITIWMATFGPELSREEIAELFGTEMLVVEAGKEYWLPVQNTLISDMEDELLQGDDMTVYLTWMGSVVESGQLDNIYLVNAFE